MRDRSCREPLNLVSGFYCSHPFDELGWLGPVLGRFSGAPVLGHLLVYTGRSQPSVRNYSSLPPAG